MIEQEVIKRELELKFDFLKDKVLIKNPGSMFVEVSAQNFKDVFVYIINQLQFSILSTITALDEVDCFTVIYHVNKDGKLVLNLKMKIPKDYPVIKSVVPYFANADIYEREIVDLLGIQVQGLSEGNRYPLPDNWPKNEYPLRKDWMGCDITKEQDNV